MTRAQANGLLLLAALIWGTTFVAQQWAMKDVGPYLYTGTRFLLGALIVLPWAWREWRHTRQRGVQLAHRDGWTWTGLGLLLFGGVTLQQVGIGSTTVTNAGFLTTLYVPLVPLLAWVLHRHRPHRLTWPAVAGSLAGAYLLAGGEWTGLTEGDWLILLSTVFWGLHVIYVGRLASHKGTPLLVATAQFLVCGVLSMALAWHQEPIHWSGLQASLPSILYGGVLSVGIAYTLQVVAQEHTRAADAAVLLSSETLFAGLAGAWVLGETLAPGQLAGYALMLASIVAVQVLPLYWATPTRRD